MSNQTTSGLMDQIHQLKQQLATARAARDAVARDYQAASRGEEAARQQLAQAEKRGATDADQRLKAVADILDVDPGDAEAEARNIRAKLSDATYRLVTVLTWHNSVESEYRDADGNVTRTVIECAHCSTLAGDGVDWPCATARALGALDSGAVTP